MKTGSEARGGELDRDDHFERLMALMNEWDQEIIEYYKNKDIEEAQNG